MGWIMEHNCARSRVAVFLALLLSHGCGAREALFTPPTPYSPDDSGHDSHVDVTWPTDTDHDRPAADTWIDPNRPPLPIAAHCTSGWCLVPGGTFTMGSPAWESCRNWSDTAETQHVVTLTRDFEISATEVTQGQYQSLMGYNPSSFTGCGANCPVEHVRWHEAAAYCNALSTKNGLPACYSCSGSQAGAVCTPAPNPYACDGYRLPTEAEWEYAYRAKTTSAYYNGDNSSCTGTDAKASAIGWYDLNASQTIHAVASKAPNGWGLFDMAGNTLEWTHDACHKDLGNGPVVDPAPPASADGNVLKGGAWLSFVRQLRAAYRTCGLPHTHSYLTGFRCARSR